MFLAAALAVAIFLLPVLVLSPVMGNLVNSVLDLPQTRAMVRRVFSIDHNATVTDLPERPRLPFGQHRSGC